MLRTAARAAAQQGRGMLLEARRQTHCRLRRGLEGANVLRIDRPVTPCPQGLALLSSVVGHEQSMRFMFSARCRIVAFGDHAGTQLADRNS